MGHFERQIANILEGKIKEKGFSVYDITTKGINNLTLDALLQRKSKKGKSYKLSTLFDICNILGIQKITLDMSEYIEEKERLLSKLSKKDKQILGIK